MGEDFSCESAGYLELCRELLVAASDDRDVVRRRLVRLGEVVADSRLAGQSSDTVDPTGALEGFDDDELTEWWLNEAWVREMLWSVAATGSAVPVAWMLTMVRFAERGSAPEFRDQLALDVRELSQLATQVRAGQSLGYLRALMRPELADSATKRSQGKSQSGRTHRVSRAWLGALETQPGCGFDALLHSLISGSNLLAVELEGSRLRHVLMPVKANDPMSIDSPYYCIDLVCHRGGWLSSDCVWTWDDATARPLDVEAIQANVDR